jgi:ubiquinone/menaquinone biosynthesis C-methylase UbiE
MNPYKIPYPDKMFDCITLMLTLHHAENIIEVINECYRLLKDDGLILLIEHDVWTDDTHMLVDLQHRIFSLINNENEKGINATYYNFYEWDMLFSKCGFKFIATEHLQEDLAFHIRYDMENIICYSKKDYIYTKILQR